MTTLATATTGRTTAALAAFTAILHRDVLVTSREAVTFMVQTLIQPLFLLFVFGKLLTGIGVAERGFSALLLPGVVAFSAFLTPLQAIATDLGRDLGFSREIDDRLLAPLPTSLVAVEKVLIAAARGALSAALVFPLATLVLGGAYHVRGDRIGALAGLMVLTASLGAALGLLLGTMVPITRLPLIFSLVITPLLFTGCTYYPWAALTRVRWFQALTLCNPLTYAAEGLRWAMMPPPHSATLPAGVVLAVLCGSLAASLAVGLRQFRRRVLR
jgi:ABC-2 type transport system permease protein